MEQVNFFTRNEYHGQNAMDLRLAKYKSSEWATYKQWLEGGYQVQKGQHGVGIMKIVEDKEGNKRPKFYKVFNYEQVKEI